MGKSVKIARCVRCNEVETIFGRGYCKKCHAFVWRRESGRVKLGSGGCKKCLKYDDCQDEQQRGYTGPLPCEEVWPDDDPALYDDDTGLNMTRPISVEIELRIAA